MLLILGLAALAACTDAVTPTNPESYRTTELALRFITAASTGHQGAPVNRIVVSARIAGATQEVGRTDRAVDPAAPSWEIPLSLEIDAVRELVISAELMNTTGTTTTVEWSGIVTVTVAPSEQRLVTTLELRPGPLAPIAQLAVTPGTADVAVGRTLTLAAVTRDASGNVITRTVAWSSSDTAKAVVSSSGVVNGKAAGDVVITAAAEGRRATSNVTVYAPAANTLERVSGNTQTTTVSTPLSLPFRVRVVDQRGNALGGVNVQWVVTAGGGSVAQVTPVTGDDGVSSAQATAGPVAGTGTVEARVTGVTGSPVVFTFTGRPASVASVTVTPGTDTVSAGDTLSFLATARDATGNIVPDVTFAWSSSDTVIARVNAAGRVLGGRAGTATITAQTAGRSGAALIRVSVGPALRLRSNNGDRQVGSVSAPLRDEIIISVIDAAGNGIPNYRVDWVVATGGGTVTPTPTLTDSIGNAVARWTLGPLVGTQTLEARAPALQNSPLIITATGTAGTQRKQWVGGAAGFPDGWSVDANWLPVGVPGDADSVVVVAAANQPRLTQDVYIGALRVEDGATLNTSGYRIEVHGSVNAAGAITGNGMLGLTGTNTTLRGNIGNFQVTGSVTANGGITASGDALIHGSFIPGGWVVEVQGNFGVGGGTITMTNPADRIHVGGSASFSNTNHTGRLTGGVIRIAGDLFNGCYNNTEFVPTGTRVIMSGTAPQQIDLACSGGAGGNRLYDLTVQTGAQVTAIGSLFIANAMTVFGTFRTLTTSVVDVSGVAPSIVVSTGGVINNPGVIRANLPVSNNGTITGNPIVQR